MRLGLGQLIGSVGIAIYGSWNVFWLTRAEVPPGMLQYFTGLPCPTTGGTRSLLAILEGDVAESLRWNPLTLAYLALTLASIACLVGRCRRGHGLLLPRALGHVWIVTLGIGWIVKLAMGPASW